MRYVSIINAAILAGMCVCACSKKRTIAPPPPEIPTPLALQVNVDFSQATPLQKNVYGINNEFIHRPYTPNFRNYKDAYLELGKPTFRYPAGTGANFINPATGFATAWPGMDQTQRDRMDEMNRALVHAGKGTAGVDVQDFIDFMKEVRPVCNYVLNVSSATVADNREALSRIRDSGVNIAHVELGNELFYNNYSSAFANAAAYINRAKSMGGMVRDIFPQAKISVVVPVEYFTDEVFLDGPPASGNRLEQWYRALQQENFYDAISVHMYAGVGMNGQTKKIDFFPFEKAYEYAISHIDGRAQYAFDRMKSDFPNKEIWLTEYHVGGFAGDLRQYRLRHTYLGGLFCADFLLKVFANPQVTLSNWHSMMQLLLYPNPSGGSLMDENTTFNLSVNAQFLKAFKEPVLHSTQYVPANLAGVAEYESVGAFKGPYKEIDAGVFYHPDTETGYLMLLNKMSTTYILAMESMGKGLDDAVIQACTVLSPHVGMPLDEALYSESRAYTGEVSVGKTALELKPYSVYVIKFKR